MLDLRVSTFLEEEEEERQEQEQEQEQEQVYSARKRIIFHFNSWLRFSHYTVINGDLILSTIFQRSTI